MKFNLTLKNIKQLDLVKKIPLDEILLLTAAFSKIGEIRDHEIGVCITQLAKSNKKIILVWDIPCKNQELYCLGKIIIPLINKIAAVRFMDPGVGLFLKSKFPELKLQISLEQGCLNSGGILCWIENFSPNLSRVILSNQIPISGIKSYRHQIDLEMELLGAGPINIFFSARPLLRPFTAGELSNEVEIIATSKERVSQRSQVKENRHGTIMFHENHLFILNCLNVIEAAGIDWLRLELQETCQYQILRDNYPSGNWINLLEKKWKEKSTRGFFKQNDTHNPLNRVLNKRLLKNNENQIGVVLESVKNEYTLVELSQFVKLPEIVLFLTPEGKKINFQLEALSDLSGMVHKTSVEGGYYLLPWIKKTVPASIILLKKRVDTSSAVKSSSH